MAIVSGGELVLSDTTPTFARNTYYAPAGVALSGLFANYGTIYRKQLWVYTLVRKRALATRRLPFKVYERTDRGREERRDSPFALLLRFPNPRMAAQSFWEWTSSTFDVYGEAIWLKVRDRRGVPAQLWPVHPSNIAVRHEDDGTLAYVYSVGTAGADPTYIIPEKDVVHFKSYNPDSTVRGLSPIEPLRQTLVNEDAARRASSALWANGGRPSGYLSHPNKLSQDALERLRGQWNDIHGGVDNFGKWAILEEGMEPKPLSLSSEELQYIESRKLNREEVCAAYDVPPPVVHILDRATFSNITEQMRSMYRDTMAPHLGLLEAVVDFQLRPEFSDDALYAEFLMDEVLRGTFEERTQQMQAAVNSGLLTPNEGRQLDNRPALPGGDRLFINSTMIPIDEVSQHTSPNAPAIELVGGEDAGTAPGETPAAAPAKVLSASVAEKVTKRAARRDALAQLDVDALTAGLNGSTRAVLEVLEKSLTAGDTPSQFCERLWALVKEDA